MPDNSINLDSVASILFVGNSFTFGRVDPVMSYNTANVRDLTAPVPGTSFASTTGSNPYEPHPWGGVPGLVEAFVQQAGLHYDVAISARNAATLQGQYLNSNPAGWDLRGNVASQPWDMVVLQDNSTQPLPSGAGSISFAVGSSKATLTLDPFADTNVETDETVALTLTAGAAYRVGTSTTVTGSILNDDPTGPVVNPALPTVTLVASPAAVLEDGTQKLVYTFTRTGSTTAPLTIQFGASRDGSTAPSVNTSTGDFENFVTGFTTSFLSNGAQTTGSLSFTSGTGSVVIAAGASTATFTLDPKSDTAVESDEAIRLTLSQNASYNVGTLGTVAVSILNDDFAAGTDTSLPNITLNLASSGVYEDGSGNLVYEFTRTGPTTAPLTVGFSVTGTATLASSDFAVVGANSLTTGGAASPDLQSFNTYAVKLAQYAVTGAADGAIPANPNANAATDVYLYETWARPNLVVGARVSTTDDQTGVVTTTTTTAPEYYASLEAMTADLRAAYEGLAAANPIFQGVAPVGAAFLRAVQEGTATRDPYAANASTDGKVDLWWDDNLHASKYGSYLSALTLFGTITGLDPRSLGAGEKAAADLGITRAEAGALQGVAAATLGFSLQANWTAPGQVTELQGTSGLLATAGAFGFSDTDTADTHAIGVSALTPGALGTLTAELHADSTGDGKGGSVNWAYTVDNGAVEHLAPGATRVERFLVTVSDANGGQAQREVVVTINGSYDNPPKVTHTYTPDGMLVSTHVDFGDGSDADLTYYPDGTRHVNTLVDTLDTSPAYSQVVTTYDANGVLASRVTTYDNGNTLAQTYAPDGARTDIKVDTAGSNPNYATETTSYNASGQITSSTVQRDDGNTVQYFYETTPGALSRTVLTDTDGNENFATQEVIYGPGVTPQWHITDYDTGQARGIRDELEWHDGWVRRKTITTDVDGAYSFDVVTTNYDASGVLANRTTLYDNGNILSQLYQPSGARTDTTTDNADVHNYATSTTSYDAAGRATGGTTLYDNGNTLVQTYFADGKPQSNVITDGGVNDPYVTHTTTFSAATHGQIETTRIAFDNGTAWLNGTATANTLAGNAANEVITGYGGADLMSGGGGSDTFWYRSASDGGATGDVITDFVTTSGANEDMLDLRAVYAELTGTGGTHNVADLVASGHLTVTQSGADTMLFVDTSAGADSNVLLATLQNTLETDVRAHIWI